MADVERRFHSMAVAQPERRSTPTDVIFLTVVAAQLATMFAGATLPTPLYPLYQKILGFGEITLTLIYAVYVLGNLTALFIFGRLSDQIGRRNASLPAIAAAIVSGIAFLVAHHVAWLFIARAVSGFATGLGSGAATAWISELQKKSGSGGGAVTASAANFVGLAVGAAVAGGLARFMPWPLTLPFIVYIVVLVIIGLAVLTPPETIGDPIQSWRDLSLKPRIGVPKDIRVEFVSPAVTAFITFALLGFYSALIPNVLGERLHETSPLVSGAVVFELFAVAALTTLFASSVSGRPAMLTGLTLFLPGVGLLIWAELSQSMPLLLIAAALAGVATSLGYRGSLEVVNGIAPDDKRSEVVSSYLMAVFLGNSVPVVGIGFLSAATSPTAAHVSFAAVIVVLAAIGIAVGVARTSAPSSSRTPAVRVPK